MVMFRRTQLVPVLCAALGACRSITDPNSQLSITVAVDRVVIDQTIPVAITVNVVNRGSRTVQTADPRSYACPRAFIVLDAADRIVPLPARTCLLIGYAPRELAPGDSITIRDQWAADMNNAAGVGPVVPGQYRIVARVISKNEQLGSKPVEVSVVARGLP
jgi:hypothetical protein